MQKVSDHFRALGDALWDGDKHKMRDAAHAIADAIDAAPPAVPVEPAIPKEGA
jgi:hypothetical protein